MKKIILFLVAVVVISAAQAQKSNRKSPIAKPFSTVSCCINKDEQATKSASTVFAEQAATMTFSNLHEAPLEFVLENQEGTMITYDCNDGKTANAYQIKATTKTDNYLLVIQEWWGLNDFIKQEADNYFNALGGAINVLAVDLYDGKIATTPDSAKSLIMAAMQSDRKEIILRGAIDYAGKKASIYTVGWCFGGMMSLQTGIMAGKQAKATIMYYGQPEKDEAKLKTLQADVLGIFGTKDQSIPNETVNEFAAKMKSLGKNFQLERYDAPHAFANPSNPSYNASAKEDAFTKSIAFLKAHM